MQKYSTTIMQVIIFYICGILEIKCTMQLLSVRVKTIKQYNDNRKKVYNLFGKI